MPQFSNSPEEFFFRQLQRFNKTAGILTLILFVIGLAMFASVILQILDTGRFSKSAVPDSEKWQAVFLTNNQVYFGRLKNLNRNYYRLTEVYYIQQGAQPQSQQSTPLSLPAQSNVNLVKLGGELHGPEDIMYIPFDRILFWENLKDDSQVVKTIESAKQ